MINVLEVFILYFEYYGYCFSCEHYGTNFHSFSDRRSGEYSNRGYKNCKFSIEKGIPDLLLKRITKDNLFKYLFLKNKNISYTKFEKNIIEL